MTGSRTLLCSALVTALGSSAFAATVNYSTSAPSLGANGISNVIAGTTVSTNVSEAFGPNSNSTYKSVSHYVAGDNAALGQTFTTGTTSAAGYRLTSITLRSPGYANTDATYYNLDGTGGLNNTGGTYTIRVVQPASSDQTYESGSAITVLASETATAATGTYPASGSTGSYGGVNTYVTFTFATPVTLAAGTLYGFDVGSDGTYGNNGDFFESLGTNNAAAYAGGTAYITGGAGVANASSIAISTGDRVFYANLAAVPEPASLGLIGLAAVGLIRRRRA